MENFDCIICVGQTAWEGDFQKAVVQLMTELSVRHRVLYVDYQYTLKDYAMHLLGKRPLPGRTLSRAQPLVKKEMANGGEVYVWTPPVMLPINWLTASPYDAMLRQNVGRLTRQLRDVMRSLDIRRPLIINGMNPVFGLPMLGKLNEWATIYYCFDEITIGRWMGRHGGRYEIDYLRRVDAVVTTSTALLHTKSRIQPNAFCVKNGVNFDLFNQANQLGDKKPTVKPIVGYLGTADDRVDLPLVEHCVRTMPDVLFQFVGEVHEPKLKQQLSTYSNVTFTPPHQPHALPPLLARMKAAMIPYVRNDHTYTIYPLKINEYLAAGLPVVSTPFAILDDFQGVIELAKEPEEFAQALQRALADDDAERRAERVAMAKNNSWAHRAQEFEEVINTLTKKRRPVVQTSRNA
jgi:glycosyltransferase involved in cell wall biosynthesis